MTDTVQTTRAPGTVSASEVPVPANGPQGEGALHARRATFVAPHTPPAETDPSSDDRSADDQELHPVSQTTTTRSPRPVSVPSHRADVELDETPPTDLWEPRPASVARHSVDMSVVTVPVLAVPVSPELPQPPERLTLDDDVLARLVARRLDDTATVDLMAVVQAQLALREVEAARFASWEDEITQVGTAEAAEALEHTRLRFTGVITVIPPSESAAARLAAPTPTPTPTPSATPAPAVLAPGGAPSSAVPAATADTTDDDQEARVVAPASAPSQPSRVVTPVPTPVADTVAVSDATPAAAPNPTSTSTPALQRTGVLVGAAGGALVVLAAVVVAFVATDSLVAALLATLAVPVAAALAGLAALASVSTRPDDASRVSRRGPVGVVLGLVVATVVGLGLVLSSVAAFAWQGYLVRAVDGTGLSQPFSVVLAVVVAAVVAYIVAVMVTGFRSVARG